VELQFLVDLLLVLEIHADNDLADIQEEFVEEGSIRMMLLW
jgi:hypothetical protein